MQGLVFRCRFPFAEDRREPTRVDDDIRSAIDHFQEVLAEIGVIHEPRTAARPWTIGDDSIERDDLLSETTGMEVIDPHGLVVEVTVESPRGLLCAAARHDSEGDDHSDRNRLDESDHFQASICDLTRYPV